MVYVYAKLSRLNDRIGKVLSVSEIEDVLKDLGMDVKGVGEGRDSELKIELTAEKLDMISCVGIARAIKYYLGLEKRAPVYGILKGKNKVSVDVKKLQRPKIVAAILREVPMDENFLKEMIEMQERIHDSFGRGRKKAAIGIYPLDNIEFPIFYRGEKPENIVFRPLGFDFELDGRGILEKHDAGRKYGFLLEGSSFFPVIRDSRNKVLSMPPVVNSDDVGKVGLKHRNLFVECTGFNLSFLDSVLKSLVTAFVDMGAKTESVLVDYGSGELYELDLGGSKDEVGVSYVNSLVGIDVEPKEMGELLKKMMYDVLKVGKGKIVFNIPPFRSDVWYDVDVADDVARAYGYNNIVPRFPAVNSVGGELEFSQFRERFCQAMIDLGFLESYTYMLSSTLDQFEKMGVVDRKGFVGIENSAEEGINMLRQMILPEVLKSLHVNRRNQYPQKIFECGFCAREDESEETGARDELHLSGVIADPKSNYTQIKGILDALMRLCGLEFEVRDSERFSYLIDGRGAEILVGGVVVGFVGEVHPKVLESFGLFVPVTCFEIDLSKIFY